MDITKKQAISEADITQAVADYCDFHGVEADAVLIDRREMDGIGVVGFRLSLDIDGRSRGCDETFGAWE